jgi:spermidine dehydrogenase
MSAEITRRDFLGSALLASGDALLRGLTPAQLLAADVDDWSGYGMVGEYRASSGNSREVMQAGHNVRDGAYPNPDTEAIETGESYDCVIVGGGISGLAAALFFQRQTNGRGKCLVIDNHPIFGGEAKQNELMSTVNISRHIKARQFTWFPTLTVSSRIFTIRSDFARQRFRTKRGLEPIRK